MLMRILAIIGLSVASVVLMVVLGKLMPGTPDNQPRDEESNQPAKHPAG